MDRLQVGSIILMVLGVILLILGIWGYASSGSDTQWKGPGWAWLLMVVGLLTFVAALVLPSFRSSQGGRPESRVQIRTQRWDPKGVSHGDQRIITNYR